MSVPPDELKEAVRHFASGVTVVAAVKDGIPHGMTASSFASVSLEPPLILVSLEGRSRTRALIVESGRFAVNILRSDQADLARTFARSDDKSFEEIAYTLEEGFPFLDAAVANLGCITSNMVPGGDHSIFVAEVACTRVGGGPPLVYHDRDYRRLADEGF